MRNTLCHVLYFDGINLGLRLQNGVLCQTTRVRNPIVGVPILPYIDDGIRLYMPTPISTIHISSLFWFADDVACMSILF